MNEKQKEITETIKAECEKNEYYQKGFITGMFYAAHISKGNTNFAKVTESTESLIGFIKSIIDVCYTCDRDEYPQCTVCWCNPLALEKWLKQESDTK